MRRSGVFVVGVIAWFALIGGTGPAETATLDEVIAAAKKEGVIEFYGPATLTPKGAQDLAAAFNKKYGLNVTLNYSPSGNMVRDVAKVVTEGASGAPPEWDLMAVTDAHHATLWLRKMHQKFDYRRLGVDPKLVEYDGGSVSFANQYVLPAYNKNVLPARDVPKSWEDLLDARWKGGKLGVSVATHHLARLAVGAWGEEKGTRYVKALADQKPILGNPGEISTKLQIGEILVYVNQIDSFIHEAKRSGAPLVFAEGIEPIISPGYHAGVPKGARHPNVAHLFAAFLTTPEAQELWERYGGQSSAFVPGTTMYKFVQGKKMVYLKSEHAEAVDRLTREYGKILGFR
jgi:iron(III) transport system substrate-binding protein